MSTDNKAVTCYLPEGIEESLTKYCVNNGLTRKNKKGLESPSYGTGIIQILIDYFQIDTSNESGFNTLKEQIQEVVIKKVMEKVNDQYVTIQKEIADNINNDEIILLQKKVYSLEKEISNLKDKPNKVSQQESITSNVPVQEDKTTQLSIPVEEKEQVEIETDNVILSISGVKLSTKRFGLSGSAIAQAKKRLSQQELSEWIREKDPDEVSWQYFDRSIGYIPIDLTEEQEKKLREWFKENLD